MPYLQVTGLKMHYVEKGRGPDTILLVHGNVSSHEYWLRFLELLPDTYRGVALDLRGCGQTDHPSEGYNIPQFVEDLTLFTDYLGLNRFHLLGHSMGGQIAMLYTLRHPERVVTLGLLDSVPADGLSFLNDEARAYFRVIMNDREALQQTMRNAVMPFSEGPSFADRSTEIAYSCALQCFTDNPESMYQTRFLVDVPKIKTPTLIIHGKDDAVIPLEFMVATMKAMVDALVVIFTHCGHSPQVERPKEFAEKYLRFIAEHT